MGDSKLRRVSDLFKATGQDPGSISIRPEGWFPELQGRACRLPRLGKPSSEPLPFPSALEPFGRVKHWPLWKPRRGQGLCAQSLPLQTRADYKMVQSVRNQAWGKAGRASGWMMMGRGTWEGAPGSEGWAISGERPQEGECNAGGILPLRSSLPTPPLHFLVSAHASSV